ncbi:MAG TPA: hypothetical protein VJR89_26430 [Polyangiales bacterium]|nr:hypothetical protein [Polyangiales bacterium]
MSAGFAGDVVCMFGMLGAAEPALADGGVLGVDGEVGVPGAGLVGAGSAVRLGLASPHAAAQAARSMAA